FRGVGREEAQTIKPLKIRYYRVLAGDTIERLARRSAFPDRNLDRFLVLNGLQRGAKLTPGEHVKIVTD
ncbi:MAG: peptidase M48, partial [Rhizobiales bacterium]|nr:peptidase M48 [Hyphomicrobiales bacterium]